MGRQKPLRRDCGERIVPGRKRDRERWMEKIS
jgi:hypothetical protein